MNLFVFWGTLRDHAVKCNHSYIVLLTVNILAKINLRKCMSLLLNAESKSRDLESIYEITIQMINKELKNCELRDCELRD